jgi:hypothetical protein
MSAAIVIVALVASAGAGSRDAGTDLVLQYDDGTASSLAWGGPCRGVWFDAGDFVEGASGIELSALEFWFFHHASYPWDTASFYADLYNGGSGGPAVLLAETSVTATHMTPVYAYYDPPVTAEPGFWSIVNTSLSAGGWPSIASDPAPTSPPHSFYWSGSAWVPAAGDYLARAHGEAVLGLEETTWGCVKALFSR